MKIKEAIKTNTVIHCSTKEEAHRILKMAYNLGYKCDCDDGYLAYKRWYLFAENTCYNLFNGYYIALDSAILNGYQIIDSTEIEDEIVDKIVEFKVGGKVKIKKNFNPEDHRNESVVFNENMDRFIGQIMTMKTTYSCFGKDYIRVEECPWNFNMDWLELVEDVAEQKNQTDSTPTHENVVITAKQTQIGGDHYKRLAIQPFEYIHKNNLSFGQGNVIKYTTRYKYKNGLEDLKKARHYIDLLIQEEYGDLQENS